MTCSDIKDDFSGVLVKPSEDVFEVYCESWYGSKRVRLFKMILWITMCAVCALWFICVKYMDEWVELPRMPFPSAENEDRKFQILINTRDVFQEDKTEKMMSPLPVLSSSSGPEIDEPRGNEDVQAVLEHTPLDDIASPNLNGISDVRQITSKDVMSSSHRISNVHGLEPLERETYGNVFSSGLREALHDARSKSHLRQADHRSKHREEYVDNSGNEVRRIGDMCSKNNRVMADIMGVDSMYFTKRCGNERHQIEFSFGGKKY